MAGSSAKTYNKLCERCRKTCKQLESVLIVTCPSFEARDTQMIIPLKFPPGRPRKRKS